MAQKHSGAPLREEGDPGMQGLGAEGPGPGAEEEDKVWETGEGQYSRTWGPVRASSALL